MLTVLGEWQSWLQTSFSSPLKTVLPTTPPVTQVLQKEAVPFNWLWQWHKKLSLVKMSEFFLYKKQMGPEQR